MGYKVLSDDLELVKIFTLGSIGTGRVNEVSKCEG